MCWKAHVSGSSFQQPVHSLSVYQHNNTWLAPMDGAVLHVPLLPWRKGRVADRDRRIGTPCNGNCSPNGYACGIYRRNHRQLSIFPSIRMGAHHHHIWCHDSNRQINGALEADANHTLFGDLNGNASPGHVSWHPVDNSERRCSLGSQYGLRLQSGRPVLGNCYWARSILRSPCNCIRGDGSKSKRRSRDYEDNWEFGKDRGPG